MSVCAEYARSAPAVTTRSGLSFFRDRCTTGHQQSDEADQVLVYDLTNTQVFESDSMTNLPTEAEMFVLTLALLLTKGLAYTELCSQTIEFDQNELPRVAGCIEARVPLFMRDIGSGERLRKRLADFVGLRISSLPTSRPEECGRD